MDLLEFVGCYHIYTGNVKKGAGSVAASFEETGRKFS